MPHKAQARNSHLRFSIGFSQVFVFDALYGGQAPTTLQRPRCRRGQAAPPHPVPPHNPSLPLIVAYGFGFCCAYLLTITTTFTFSTITMMFFFVDTSDWSSTLVRQNRFDEFVVVREIAHWALLTLMGFIALYFIASTSSYHRSQSLPMSEQNQARVTGPWTTCGWFLLALMLALMDWMEHDLDCRMDFGFIFACFIAHKVMHFAFLVAFRSWKFFFSTTKASVVTDDDDDEEDDDTADDMDWEPTSNATIHQGRRVYFSFNPVASTHIVPRDCLHEIARGRGRRIVAPSVEKKFPGRLFLSTGRALPSIPEGPERVHFFADLVSTTHFVPRDSTNEIARGRRIVKASSCEKVQVSKDDVSEMSIVHDDCSECQTGVLVHDDDMDWEFTPTVVLEFVGKPVATFGTTESESESESGSEAGSLDGASSVAMVYGCIGSEMDLCDNGSDQERYVVDVDDVATSVEVPALRRSKRLAERRLRLQEKNEVESKVKVVVASTCNQVLVPDLLGSTFVNGRRRSTRHLKTNVDVVA